MSDTRPLHKEEVAIIERMLQASSDHSKPQIDSNATVRQMDDGGMGSIKFSYPDRQPLDRVISEAQYRDTDDVLVSISLNVDKSGRLFELDFWKVDFSPLKRYPLPFDLVFKD